MYLFYLQTKVLSDSIIDIKSNKWSIVSSMKDWTAPIDTLIDGKPSKRVSLKIQTQANWITLTDIRLYGTVTLVLVVSC